MEKIKEYLKLAGLVSGLGAFSFVAVAVLVLAYVVAVAAPIIAILWAVKYFFF